LDALSISDYLNARGCPQPLRGLIETAYTTEYGAAASDQSVLNFLIMFAEESPESFKAGHGDDTSPDVLGSSDERYKFVLGSECLPKALLASVVGARPAAAPRLEHRLVAIRPVSGDPHSALQLVLDQGGGNEVIHEVDRVILALPFNQLRKVDLTGLQLDPEKKRAIQELGYGRSGKFICGTSGRPWRGAGHNGSAYLSSPQQVLTWDTTRSRPGDSGGLSFFLAGDGTALLQQKSGEELEGLLRPALEKALPELRGMDITRTLKANWPAEAHIEAGYTALRPGQWTAFSGIEAQAAMDGRLLFAGEHTSVAYQGYLEGAIESGQRAAKEALANISDQRRRTRQ
jgi:monoamine oxidase